MENPYGTPSPGSLLADDSRRPVGVSILSVLTAILGFVLLAAFVVLVVNWRENNEFALSRRMAPSIFWFFSGMSVIMTVVAATGMWRGRTWGWWIACCGLVLFVLQNLASTAMVNLSAGAPSVATFLSANSLKFLVRGTVFATVLAYWLRQRVRKYFHVEQTGPIKAIVLSAICGVGLTAAVTVVLQTVFLFRTR